MAEDLRIDEVEKEVKKLKTNVVNFTELKNTINDLKNTVMDIRALMSETQNPFNLLRFITDEDELNKLIKARPLLEKKFSAKVKMEAKGATDMAGREVRFTVESDAEPKDASTVEVSESPDEKSEETMDKTETENQAEEGMKEGKEQEYYDRNCERCLIGLGGLFAIVRWIYKMLDLGFDDKSIGKICEYCEFFCFMPRGYSQQVSNVVGAVIKARSQKISAEEFTLCIYTLAEAVGSKIDLGDLSGLIMQVLNRNRAETCGKCVHERS